VVSLQFNSLEKSLNRSASRNLVTTKNRLYEDPVLKPARQIPEAGTPTSLYSSRHRHRWHFEAWHTHQCTAHQQQLRNLAANLKCGISCAVPLRTLCHNSGSNETRTVDTFQAWHIPLYAWYIGSSLAHLPRIYCACVQKHGTFLACTMPTTDRAL
jgi:hypothetical protein